MGERGMTMNNEIPINQIVCGDCLEVMKALPNGCIDLVLADPPYGMTSNKWDSELPLDRLWNILRRVIRENAVVALFSGQPFTSTLIVSNLEMWRHEWVWIKNRGSNFANTVREPFKEHETIQIFSRGKWTYNKQMQPRTGGGLSRVQYSFDFRSKSSNYRNFEGRENVDLGKLRVPSSWQKFNTEVGLHPTQKPVGLCEYLIRTYSNPGQLVLDFSCGSGTTCVAAKKLGRNYIGIDISPEYCAIARKRLEETV
jgi:site-specific DNA-methyltransferase (adenine-specific)